MNVTPDWRNLPDGYFAVLHPRDPDRMTYWWRRSGRNGRPEFLAWPLKTDVTALAGCTCQIVAAIAADPVAAGKRFAEFTTRCCMCGRRLRDAKSKASGIGPECRKTVPDRVVAQYLVPAVGRAHAASAGHVQDALFLDQPPTRTETPR